MNFSVTEAVAKYNLLVAKRKRLWLTFYTTYENVNANSEDIAITDLPLPLNAMSNNTSYANRKPIYITPNNYIPEEEDINNEDNDDLSEAADSVDTAKFSDSDEENEVEDSGGNQIVYETDTDEELSEDLDDTSTNGDFIDQYLEAIRYSKMCSNDNAASGPLVGEDPLANNNLCQTQRKRTFSKTGFGDGGIEERQQLKKMHCKLKTMNVYINVNEVGFESDNE